MLILQIFTPLPLRPQLVCSLLTGVLHQPSPITLTVPFSSQHLKLHSLPTCTETVPALSWLVLPHLARGLVPSGIGHIAVSGRLGELELPLGGNLFSFCSVDGNHLQPPAGDRDPHGILCLQVHLVPGIAEQRNPSMNIWKQNKLSCTGVSGEVEIRTFLLGNNLWSG